MEEKRSEAMDQLERENAKLKENITESRAMLDQSRSVEGKVDALQLIIEQRDQLLAERDAEIKSSKSKLASYMKKHEEDAINISELEAKLKKSQGDLKNVQREVEELQTKTIEKDEINATVSHMKEELTDAITEISTLRE